MMTLYLKEMKFSVPKSVFLVLNITEKIITLRMVHNHNKDNYLQCYKILGLQNNADQDSVRRAFIDLCKIYHPDSGSPEADSIKFQKIENAYRTLQNKFADERWNVNEGLGEYGLYYDEKKRNKIREVEVFDIKHTAPQHRQYLSFDGVGSGTPAQRQKQYAAHQALTAAQNVQSHRFKKISEGSDALESALVMQDKKEAKKIKTRYGIERLVEDLIQESMAKGEFDNLKGAGKPLAETNYNPYVDLVTHKLNQVMIDNGFIPEWITLQKEITEDIELVNVTLREERKNYGQFPLTVSENKNWEVFLEKMKEDVNNLNRKIDKFNLVVPILDKQMLHFNLLAASKKILQSGEFSKVNERVKGSETKKSSTNSFDILSIFIRDR